MDSSFLHAKRMTSLPWCLHAPWVSSVRQAGTGAYRIKGVRLLRTTKQIMEAIEMKKFFTRLACLIPLLMLVSPMSALAVYPERTIRLVVAFSAGGPTDLAARLVADEWSKVLGQTVIVENRTGAHGQIATMEAARANPDGYTLYLAASGVTVIGPAVYESLPYDMERDFEFIGGVVNYSHVLVTSNTGRINNVDDIFNLSRTPEGIRAATVGHTNDLAIEWLNIIEDAKIERIPYRGHAVAFIDLVADRIDMAMIAPNVAMPLREKGQVKILALTDTVRTADMHDIPSMSELGYPEYNVSVFSGVVAPKGTPAEIVKKLEETLQIALDNEELKKKIEESGQVIISGSGDEFRQRVSSEVVHWSEVAKAANIQIK